MSNINFDYLLKYIIVGDSFVGKSNILIKWTKNNFKSDHEITIGVEFGAKNIIVGKDEKVLRIQIWDTAGQETFRSITRAYYKNSVCAFLVYDISNRQSFKNIFSWLDECKAQSPKTILLVLVGNKIDLEDRREVSYEEGKEFASNNGLLFFETSAKTNINIDQIFLVTGKEIHKKIYDGCYDLSNENCGIKRNVIINSKINIDESTIKKEKKKKKNNCC